MNTIDRGDWGIEELVFGGKLHWLRERERVEKVRVGGCACMPSVPLMWLCVSSSVLVVCG